MCYTLINNLNKTGENIMGKQERITGCEAGIARAKKGIADLTIEMNKLVVDGQIMDFDEYNDYRIDRNIEKTLLTKWQAELANAQAIPEETVSLAASIVSNASKISVQSQSIFVDDRDLISVGVYLYGDILNEMIIQEWRVVKTFLHKERRFYEWCSPNID